MEEAKDNIQNLILKKIPLYSNIKYQPIFVDILLNIKRIIKKDNDKNRTKIFDNKFYKDKTINSDLENKSHSLWSILINSIFLNEKYKRYFVTKLEFYYLKNKAKVIYNKILKLSLKINQPYEYILKEYISEINKKNHKIQYRRSVFLEIKELEILIQKRKNLKHKYILDNSLQSQINKRILSKRKSLQMALNNTNEDSNRTKKNNKTGLLEKIFNKISIKNNFNEQLLKICNKEYKNLFNNKFKLPNNNKKPNNNNKINNIKKLMFMKSKSIEELANINNKNFKYSFSLHDISQKKKNIYNLKNINHFKDNKFSSSSSSKFLLSKENLLPGLNNSDLNSYSIKKNIPFNQLNNHKKISNKNYILIDLKQRNKYKNTNRSKSLILNYISRKDLYY